MPALEELLATSAALHHHLCPRQVLGVLMGYQGQRTSFSRRLNPPNPLTCSKVC
jgi:formylmethanofuran dehydrogenase subunit E